MSGASDAVSGSRADLIRRLVKMGGISGVILGVVQLAGIIMHGSIPADPGEGLAFVHSHPVWVLTHILLIASYLFVVGFYVGLRATLDDPPPWMEIAANLSLVGAILGAVHFTIHLSLYPFLAGHHHGGHGMGGETAFVNQILTFYQSVHTYAHILNRCSLFILMMVAFLFAIAMRREPRFKRWIAILGLVSSLVTIATVIVVETMLPHQTGDIVFAIALLPTIVWIVASGISMLRMKPAIPTIPPLRPAV